MNRRPAKPLGPGGAQRLQKYSTKGKKVPGGKKVPKEAHDRFLVIDEKEIYHIGASLKDLGKKSGSQQPLPMRCGSSIPGFWGSCFFVFKDILEQAENVKK